MFHQLKFHTVVMHKEEQGESGDSIVAQAVEERCKNFGTIYIPFITINIEADLLFRNFSSTSTNSRGETLGQNGTHAVEFGRCEKDQVERLAKNFHVFWI